MTPPSQTLFSLLGEEGLHPQTADAAKRVVLQIEQLLKNGADPNALNEEGQTPLGALAAVYEKPSEHILPILDALIVGVANPLRYDNALKAFATHRSETIADSIPIALLKSMARNSQATGDVLLDTKGNNALHVLAEIPHALAMCLLYSCSVYSTTADTIESWAHTPNPSGNCALHIVWGNHPEFPLHLLSKQTGTIDQDAVRSALLAVDVLYQRNPACLYLKNSHGKSVLDSIIQRVEGGASLEGGTEVANQISIEINARRLENSTQCASRQSRNVRF